MDYHVIGHSIPRTDNTAKVTGDARYTSDVLLPGTLWAKTLRSPHSHARILRVDTSRAERAPGVRAVLTGNDVRGILYGRRYRDISVLAQDKVRRLVEATVQFDREAAARSGCLPVACEVDAEGTLSDGTGGDAIRLHGRWDRLDRHPMSGAVRVIDYKYRAQGRMEAKDRQLLQAALRAQRLQPALYALMAAGGSHDQAATSHPEQVEFVYLLPQGEPLIERASFAAADWQGPSGPELSRTLQLLTEGIRGGRHFITPDPGYCGHGEFATACRKAHQPSWWRARRSSPAGALREVRSQKVARD